MGERGEGSKKHSRTFTRNTYIHPIDQSINQSINQSIKTLDSGGRMSSSTRSTPARQGSTSRQSVRASSLPERNAQKDWRKFFLNSGSAFAHGGSLRKTICTRLTERTGSPSTTARGIQRRARACLASRRNTLQRSRVSDGTDWQSDGGVRRQEAFRGARGRVWPQDGIRFGELVLCCGSIGSNGPDENKEFIEEIIL